MPTENDFTPATPQSPPLRAPVEQFSGDLLTNRSRQPVQRIGDRFRLTAFMPRHFLGLAILLLVVVIAFGWPMQKSLERFADDSLNGLLAGHAQALERWFGERLADANQISGSPDIMGQAAALLAGKTLDQVNADEFNDMTRSSEYQGWCVVTPQSKVVASDITSLTGARLAVPEDAWKTLVGRQPAIALPFPAAGEREPRATATNQEEKTPAAWMAVMIPLVEGARTQGALVLLIDPRTSFLPLATSSWIGASGQTYAFDADGLFVTPVRTLYNGMLTASARIPVSNHSKPLKQVDQTLPLTMMADQATRGGTGSNVKGYVDFRGEEVIGAWTWLPDYKVGLATETTVREAYAPIVWLKWLTLLGVLSLAVLQLVALFARRRLKQRESTTGGQNTMRTLGPYELGELIGQGGMGAVYRARHRLLGRDVAIKVLEGEEVNALSVSRFEREVKMTSQLRHPNTIEIYDYGVVDEETYYYVMEYVDGITLQELIEDFGAQPPSRVIHLMQQICGSLSEAHQLGMIHRDIKPANILLTARAGLYDMVKVLDFGLVREVDRDAAELTRSDGITGTPMYMPPESVRDATKANEKSDLYSTGAVGYTLLTGLPTFDGDSSVDVCLKQLNDEPLRPSERLGKALPDDLQNLLMSCLRKEPEERPHTMEELESSLRQCDHAGEWTAADALRWWEMDFQGRMHKNGDKSSDTLTNRLEANRMNVSRRRDVDAPQAATGDSGTTTVH